jgi:Ku protein
VACKEEEEFLVPIPGHTTWSGSLSVGLVNIPVRVVSITAEIKISFRMLHQKCKTPISCRIFCEEGNEIPKSEIAHGYKLKGHDYLFFDKKEIASAKPESSKVIDLDRFVNFFSVDPHYFERTWLFITSNSEKTLCSASKGSGPDRSGRHWKDDHEHATAMLL